MAVICYLLIVLFGCLCITSASSEDSTGGLFSFGNFYMKQLVWVGVAWTFGLLVLLLDASLFHKWAYVSYGAGILCLVAVLLFGREVNGAKAWFELGPVRWQPVEVAKIATALALARLMSEYSFSISRPGDLFRVGVLLLIPLAIIVLQNDTGSGIVLGSFLFVLYREGLNKWLCIPILMIAALFIVSFLLSPIALLLLMLLVCTLSEAMMNGRWRSRIVFLASIFLGSAAAYFLLHAFLSSQASYYSCLLATTLAGVVVAAVYSFRHRLSNAFLVLGLFVCSMIFLPTTDYIFNSILKDHQRNRILSFLGVMSDPLGTDYNVNQSKIAIGSGGFYGKGFLNGTQTKLKYVPEQHTDFIFCTIGEEEGFIGAVLVTLLFIGLILRVIVIGERQPTIFGRVYAYCVASYFTFHFCINIGMVIGLTPVIGIPLPFFSYGGSSLWGFTTLLFILLKIDASRKNVLSY